MKIGAKGRNKKNQDKCDEISKPDLQSIYYGNSFCTCAQVFLYSNWTLKGCRMFAINCFENKEKQVFALSYLVL